MLNFTPKKMLVTGGAGFIGSNFIRHVLGLNAAIDIINLDNLTYAGSLSNLENLPNSHQHHFIKGDICDRPLIDKILKEYNIDTIVHFAAESHVDRSISGPGAFIQTNIVGTFTLLEAAKQYWMTEKQYQARECRFHHVSTDEVFGSLNDDDSSFNEKTPYSPNSPYSASKASSDHLVRAYYSTYGLPITLSNCSNNYGPYQHKEKLIPTVILACLNQRPIPVYGNGTNIRDWLYVEDHCVAIYSIICNGQIGESYNVGGENELTNLQLIQKICSVMDEHFPDNAPHKNLIKFIADRLGHDWRYAIDNNKLKESGLWHQPISFDIALMKTIEFYIHDLCYS